MSETTTSAPAVETKAAPALTIPAQAPVTEREAALMAEIITLRAKSQDLPKHAASDAEFSAAIAQLEKEAAEDLAKANPSPRPALSLAKVLGFIPNPKTAEQNKAWKEARKGMESRHSAKHRLLLAERSKLLRKTIANPSALVATVAKVRKDGTTARVSVSASAPAKAKKSTGRSKGAAKPTQVAAKVPVAGNAVNPATVS